MELFTGPKTPEPQPEAPKPQPEVVKKGIGISSQLPIIHLTP